MSLNTKLTLEQRGQALGSNSVKGERRIWGGGGGGVLLQSRPLLNMAGLK